MLYRLSDQTLRYLCNTYGLEKCMKILNQSEYQEYRLYKCLKDDGYFNDPDNHCKECTKWKKALEKMQRKVGEFDWQLKQWCREYLAREE